MQFYRGYDWVIVGREPEFLSFFSEEANGVTEQRAVPNDFARLFITRQVGDSHMFGLESPSILTNEIVKVAVAAGKGGHSLKDIWSERRDDQRGADPFAGSQSDGRTYLSQKALASLRRRSAS